MRRTSVLLFIDSVAQDAGTERYVAEMVRRLDRSRFELHLGCLEDSDRLGELAGPCATRVFPIVKVFRPRGLAEIARLHRYINRHAIDVVHAFMPKATIVATLGALGSRARAVVASRRNLGYWYTPSHLRLLRFLNRHTTRILANSKRVKEFVVRTERVPAEMVDVLYNGVDMDRFSPAPPDPAALASLGIPPRDRLVGIVANFRPVKDLGLFLRAARLVAAQEPDTAFLLVGHGPLRQELGRLAQELGIADRVFFSDGKGSVPDYLRRMSIACLSSESEGFSNAILEYMASGLPVVATDVGGNAEAVQDGLTGCLVATRDPEAFAAPILALLRDEPRRAAMAAAALERCRRNYEIGGAIERQEQYYLSLLEATAP